MSKRLTSGFVAVIAAVSMSIPAVGLADKGGHPHSTNACKVHSHAGLHRGATKGHKRGADRGKKCGWGQTGQTGSTHHPGDTGKPGNTPNSNSQAKKHHGQKS